MNSAKMLLTATYKFTRSTQNLLSLSSLSEELPITFERIFEFLPFCSWLPMSVWLNSNERCSTASWNCSLSMCSFS